MGPVEVVFLAIIAVFVAIGAVRGYARELGVTVMLLLALFVLLILEDRYGGMLTRVLGLLAPGNTAAQDVIKAYVFCGILLLVAFISYQGETLSFSSKSRSLSFSLGAGLLNGYLLAGSIWYYLHRAGYPFIKVTEDYSEFYKFVLPLLPPAAFSWPLLIALALLLLLARVLR